MPSPAIDSTTDRTPKSETSALEEKALVHSPNSGHGRWIVVVIAILLIDVLLHGTFHLLFHHLHPPIEVYAFTILGVAILLTLFELLYEISDERRVILRDVYEKSKASQEVLCDRLTSLHAAVNDANHHVSLMSKLNDREREGIPGLIERRNQLEEELRLLATGEVHLTERDAMLQLDARRLQKLNRDDYFRAVVPFGPMDDDEDTIGKQLKDDDFQQYVDTQKEACKRGVRVQRLYLFHTQAERDRADVEAHFADLVDAGCEVRFIVGMSKKQLYEMDLNIFGEECAAPAKRNRPKEGLNIIDAYFKVDSASIKKCRAQWDDLWNRARHHAFVMTVRESRSHFLNRKWRYLKELQHGEVYRCSIESLSSICGEAQERPEELNIYQDVERDALHNGVEFNKLYRFEDESPTLDGAIRRHLEPFLRRRTVTIKIDVLRSGYLGQELFIFGTRRVVRVGLQCDESGCFEVKVSTDHSEIDATLKEWDGPAYWRSSSARPASELI